MSRSGEAGRPLRALGGPIFATEFGGEHLERLFGARDEQFRGAASVNRIGQVDQRDEYRDGEDGAVYGWRLADPSRV